MILTHVAPELDALIAEVESRPVADGLDALSQAEAVAAELVAMGDRLVGVFVERARREGHSWADIGARVGVTRQAAQQRFGVRSSALTLADLTAAGSLERVTGRGRVALQRADALARTLGHESLDAEHLLLALLDDRDALAARALASMGIDADVLDATVRARRPAGTGSPAVLPVGATGRGALRRSLQEAVSLGHNYIGTEHLLLGVLDAGDPDLTAALSALGIDRDGTVTAIGALLDAYLRQRE